MKKLLILFLALLLPVLIYLFLKSFGKNEFEVPMLFHDSVNVAGDCSTNNYQAPYTIPDSVLKQISWNETDTITIVVLEDGVQERKHERDIHIERVFTQFKTETLHLVRVFEEKTAPDLKRDRLTEVSLSQEDFRKFRECVFLLHDDQDAVIVDRYKRIRGQYNLVKREDADRMIMQEMNILFKRY